MQEFKEIWRKLRYLLVHKYTISVSFSYETKITSTPKIEEILKKAEDIAIADAYDAMTSERSYRSALSDEVVIGELRKNAGIQFAPELADVFIDKLIKQSWLRHSLTK